MPHDVGRVKVFDADRGFGFIQRRDGQDFFVHISACPGELPLEKGDKVSFDIAVNARKNKPEAIDVQLIGAKS